MNPASSFAQKEIPYDFLKFPAGSPVVSSSRNESKVLVLFTGGTIGMTPNDKGMLSPISGKFRERIRKDINFHDSNYDLEDTEFLVLPSVNGDRRVVYKIKEYESLLDSSSMDMNDWSKIADDVYIEYRNYNGFVVLHGTDTLAFTSSALSFMLENLAKPVIVTGSQIPIYQAGSDGIQNFIASLKFAGLYDIPEVCVAFGRKLLRGNRTVKMNCESFDAFESPNFPPLAVMGVQFKVDKSLIHRQPLTKACSLQSSLDPNVSLLRLTPNMPLDQISGSLGDSVRGVVLQSFGAGNIPNRSDLLNELKAAIDRGVIIVNCTQCPHGGVVDAYDASSEIKRMGVIFLEDITMEAAYTKLSYVLSKSGLTLEQKKEKMRKSLRGELTERQAGE